MTEKRFTYYWYDYMNCQVVVDNQTTEEYSIEDNRVQDSKYDNNGIEYLVNKMNEQDERIQQLEESLGFCRDLLDGTCNSTRMKELHKIIQEMVTDD